MWKFCLAQEPIDATKRGSELIAIVYKAWTINLITELSMFVHWKVELPLCKDVVRKYVTLYIIFSRQLTWKPSETKVHKDWTITKLLNFGKS